MRARGTESIESLADERQTLKRKAFSGLSWQTTNTLVRQVLTFSTGIVLARMLTPADFGLINIAVIATTWVGILGGLGIETYLIQRTSLEEEEIDAGFWIAGGVGFLSAATLFLASPFLSSFYRSAVLTEMLHVFAISLLLGGLNVVPASLLRRSLNFKGVARVEIIGTLVSGCVAVTLVVLGWGPVSIPWGGVAGLSVSMLVYQRLGLWSFRPLPKKELLKKVAGRSSIIAGSTALDLIRIFIDNAIVGRFLGTRDLGYYSLGYNLISVPEYRIVGLVTSVAFPALSSMRMEAREIGKAYLRILKYTSAVVMPLLVGLMLLADRVIPLVYGPVWLPAVPIVRVLCFAGLGTAVVAVTDSPLLALGRNRTIFVLNLVWVSALVAAVLITLVVSPTLISVAYVVAVVAVVMAFARNIIIIRSSSVSAIEILGAFKASVLSTLSMVLIIVAIDFLAPAEQLNWIHTGVDFLAGSIVYTIVASLFFSELRSSFAQATEWLQRHTGLAGHE